MNIPVRDNPNDCCPGTGRVDDSSPRVEKKEGVLGSS